MNFHYEKDDNREMTWYTMKSNEGKGLKDKLNIIFIDLVSIRKKYGTPAENIIRYMSKEDANWFTQNSIDIYERDHNTTLANAEKRGLEKGMQQKAQETAINMLKKNYPAADISEVTGLPLEKVLELQKTVLVQA